MNSECFLTVSHPGSGFAMLTLNDESVLDEVRRLMWFLKPGTEVELTVYVGKRKNYTWAYIRPGGFDPSLA